MKSTKKTRKPRVDLDQELIADLELSEREAEAIAGGQNYTRMPTVVT